MHECPWCGMECDCDGEDLSQPAPEECSHECEEEGLEDEPIFEDWEEE